MSQEVFGLNSFIDKAKTILSCYTEEGQFDKSRGIMVHGPPGTGKSYLLDNLIKYLRFEPIFSGSSSSFNQPY
jgi:SpoVK/Ycf46/Vps4 family AAA+-type ATPase